MEVIKINLKIGVQKPFKVLHVTDTHLTLADKRDGERKLEHSKLRSKNFPNALNVLEFASKIAKEENALIVHTGDFIDFISTLNLETVEKFNKENNCVCVAGNHEFAQFVGEGCEDIENRNKNLAVVEKYFSNDIRIASKIVNGINFVALDNSYYNFDKEQFCFLREQVAKGLPIILLLHNPLYEKDLYDLMMKSFSSAYLVAVPENLMKDYPLNRYNQQLANDTTKEVVEYIANQPNIKAIFSGHMHFNYQGLVNKNLIQYITSCTDVRIFEIS